MIWSDQVRHAARHLAAVPPERVSPPALVALRALQRAGAHAAETFAVRFRRWQADGSEPPGGPARMLRQLLIMPVGDRCNLACRYCYEATRRADGGGSMSRETLRRVLVNVLPYVQQPFAIGWHGGEPLLRGKRFFRDAFRLVHEVAGGAWVQQIVQSNATLLDDEWVEMFREHGAAVGISLDGPPPVNDAVRIRPDGSGSYEAVTRGIAALRTGGVPFSTIVVISAAHARRPGQARQLLDHFREMGITLYDVHPAYSHTPLGADHNLHPDTFASFTTELFDRWLDTGDTTIRINFFEHVLQGMGGQRSVACYLSGGCTTILGVGPDGRAIPCTRPFDTSYTFGSLAEQTLPEILEGDVFRRFAARELAGRTPGGACEWAAVCGGGCPHERVSQGTQAVEGTNVYCTCGQGGRGGYPEIFRHMQTRIERVLTDAAAGTRPRPARSEGAACR